jgi:hypothetical protein
VLPISNNTLSVPGRAATITLQNRRVEEVVALAPMKLGGWRQKCAYFSKLYGYDILKLQN